MDSRWETAKPPPSTEKTSWDIPAREVQMLWWIHGWHENFDGFAIVETGYQRYVFFFFGFGDVLYFSFRRDFIYCWTIVVVLVTL